MSKENNPLDSLNKGKFIAAAADFLAAFFFFIAFIIDGSIYFLIASIALVLSGIAIFVVFEKFKNKFNIKK